MEDTQILTGFVHNLRAVNRQGIAFQLGTSPEWMYMGGRMFAPPFNENEYLIVAVRRSIFAGGQFTVLAFRDAGLRAPPRIASLARPIVFLLFGLLVTFAFLTKLKADMPPIVMLFFCTIIVVGALVVVGGVRRVIAGFNAKPLLEQWQPSVEDLQAQRNVDS